MAKCKFCQADVFWIKVEGRNCCTDSYGNPHRCEEMKKSLKSIKKLDRNSLSPEEIKRYENSINNKK